MNTQARQFQVQQTVEVISADNKVLVRYWDKYPLKIMKLLGQQLSNIQTKTDFLPRETT